MAAAKPKATAKKTTVQKAAKPVAKAPAAKKVAAKKVAAKKVVAKKLAAKPAVKVFQFYTEAWQREVLDPAFVPLDNAKDAGNELREVALFERLLKDGSAKDAPLWGAVSWQFTEKTGLKGAELLKQVADNPGHDVYFCNTYASNEATFHNTWMQGVTEFPQFLAVAQAVFKAAGLDESELTSVHPSTSYSRGNYFVASPKFWALYLTFVRQVLAAAEKKLPAAVLNVLHTKLPDPRGVYQGATYVPLIVERLFSYFMHKHGKGLKSFKLVLPKAEAELNVHQKLLREMKNVAHQTKSPWMAACWVNYRNLYLAQNNSKAWCAKYLRVVTPAEVRFA